MLLLLLLLFYLNTSHGGRFSFDLSTVRTLDAVGKLDAILFVDTPAAVEAAQLNLIRVRVDLGGGGIKIIYGVLIHSRNLASISLE